VNVAYYNNGFGPAELQLIAVLIWLPLQVASLLVYPGFKVRLCLCVCSILVLIIQVRTNELIVSERQLCVNFTL